MLKVNVPTESVSSVGVAKIGICNLSAESCGQARVNLPLELSLPADPLRWTKRQTQNWLCWLREVNDLEQIDITHFNVDGVGLCSLTQQIIEEMVGVKASNIFRATLDLLKSTAALVRHTPPEISRQNIKTPPRDIPLSQPEALPMTQPEIYSQGWSSSDTSPDPLRSPQVLGIPTITSPYFSMPPHYDRKPIYCQTPVEVPIYSRSSVITAEDIARLQPVAKAEEIPRVTPMEKPRVIPTEKPRVTPMEIPRQIPNEIPREISRETPREIPREIPRVIPMDIPREIPRETLRKEIKSEAPDTPEFDKLGSRRFSGSSVESEEDKLNGSEFSPKLSRRPPVSGVDCGRQGITLWQFILELLANNSCKDIVAWTDNHLEFKVMNSKKMAERWGSRKNRPKMNYDKLSRALRYYYRKNLIQHVPGKRQVYYFVEHPESLDFTQLLDSAMVTHPSRARKHSAFTHVNQTNKRASFEPEYTAQKKRVSESGHVSMLGYPGKLVPHLLTLQSPFTLLPQISLLDAVNPRHEVRQPRPMLEMFSSASNHSVMTSSLTMSSPPTLTSSNILHKISVMDTGCAKGVF